MIKNNDSNEISNKMVSERNDLPSYNMKNEKIIKNSSKVMSDSKLKQNAFKNKNLNSLFNYSFSNKTSGNEFSKLRFESIEKQTLDLDNEINYNSKKEKDVPIYINYSDYFYCPDSIKEKNLNFQIMKYLYDNNLIKDINYIKKKNVKKCKKRTKSKKINNNNIKKCLKLEEVNNLNNLNDKNKSITFSNNYESNELNKSLKGIYNNSFNKNKILCNSEQSNIEKFENNKIEYINYQDIHICKSKNTIDKPKETFYTFRTGKLFNNNKFSSLTKISSSNNSYNNSSFSQSEQKSKKKKNETKKNKNIVPKKSEINDKKKNSKNMIDGINKNNNKKYELEICFNVVNEQFNVKIDKKDIQENNDINELISVSLQSINDSKMFELAETFLPKEEDEEIEKFEANEILKRKKIYK